VDVSELCLSHTIFKRTYNAELFTGSVPIVYICCKLSYTNIVHLKLHGFCIYHVVLQRDCRPWTVLRNSVILKANMVTIGGPREISVYAGQLSWLLLYLRSLNF
jgi:hypothetical protein